MYIYLFVLIILILLSRLAQKYQSDRIVLSLSALIVCFTGFRAYSVGIDTENYILIWDNVLVDGLVYEEPGFIWLIKFLQQFTHNPTVLFLVCSAVIYPLIIHRLWDFRNIASFPVMVTTFYFCDIMISMNIIRQYMGVAIVFYFSRFLFKGNNIVYLIGVLLASTLHLSSLISMALFAIELLRWKELSKVKKLIYVAGIAAFFMLFGTLMNFADSEYGDYLASNSSSEVGMMTTLKVIFIFVSCFIFNIFKKNKYSSVDTYKTVFMIIVLSITGLLLETLGYFFPYMDRLGVIFHMFFLVYWGVLYKNIKGENIHLYTFIYLLLIVYPFISTLIHNGQGTVPFKFNF